MKPHKWAKEIHAWADGAEIEMWYRQYDGWGSVTDPTWYEDNEYRIKPQKPHEVSEQYGKAVQQAYEDGFVQGKIYAETGRVSDGATIPKEPQYLYVYKDEKRDGYIALSDIERDTKYEYIGKIKLETDDDTRS